MIGSNLWNKKYVAKLSGKELDNLSGDLYQHIISINSHTQLVIISASPDAMTADDLYQYCKDLGLNSTSKYLPTIFAGGHSKQDATHLEILEDFGIYAYETTQKAHLLERSTRITGDSSGAAVNWTVTTSTSHSPVGTLLDYVTKI